MDRRLSFFYIREKGGIFFFPVDEDLYFAELQKKIAAGNANKANVVEVVQGDMSSTF